MDINLTTVFSEVEDPRRDLGQQHKLNDILHICIIAVICGAESWNNIEEYACSKVGFLKEFLELPNGIPTHDTFNRVLSALDPKQFEAGFIKWVNVLAKISKGEVVAIDGKTIRGAKSHGKKSPFHIVSAWANERNLVLGQVMTDEKSNEITAIPKLLEILALENTVVTIDAMGCQENIAKCIIKKDADYILAVKENQKSLLEDIQDEFTFSRELNSNTTIDGDHGRVETRKCSVINSFKHLQQTKRWEKLTTIIKIESTREFKNSDKATEQSVRYYISSLDADAQQLQRKIRNHWAIENKLHWTLDVAFGEDASRKRNGYAAQNFSTLNKIALNLLKNEISIKIGIKGRRLKAAWDDDYLKKVIGL